MGSVMTKEVIISASALAGGTIGQAIAQVERAYPNVAEVDRATVDTVEVDRAKYDTVEFMILRRGIIGVNKIGYVL